MKHTTQRTVVSGLAAARLVRAWKFEEIGSPFYDRAQRVLHQPVFNGDGTVNIKATVRREWLADLLECPHCVGFWATLGMVILIRNRWARPLVEGLAGAMIMSTIVQWYPGFSFEEPDPKEVIVTVKDGDVP